MKVFKSNELQISSCAGRKQEDLILSIVKPLNPTTLSVVKFRKNPTLIRNFNPNAKRIFLCVSNLQGMPDSIRVIVIGDTPAFLVSSALLIMMDSRCCLRRSVVIEVDINNFLFYVNCLGLLVELATDSRSFSIPPDYT